MDLAGFQPFNFSLGVPSVSITGHGVTFNKSTVLKLGSPEYVRLFINHKSRQIAVRVCEKSDTNAARFYRQKKSGVISVRWNHGGLLWELQALLGTDLKNHGFRIYGEQTDYDTVLFDLNAAKPLK